MALLCPAKSLDDYFSSWQEITVCTLVRGEMFFLAWMLILEKSEG